MRIMAILTVLMLGLTVLLMSSSWDVPLDQAVGEQLVYSLPEPAPEDNIYIGVCGLGLIQDGDVVTAGQKYVQGGAQYQADPKRNKFLIMYYQNPCHNMSEKNCLAQIVAGASAMNEEIEKNKDILERYQTVQNMTRFVNLSGITDNGPQYQILHQASSLIRAKALLDIKQGRVSAGLNSLEKELDFYKRIYQSEYVSLGDLLSAVDMTRHSLNAIKNILEDDQIDLRGQEDRLRKMLDVNLSVDRMMGAAMKWEKRQVLHIPDLVYEEATDGDMSLERGLARLFLVLLFKKNRTINELGAKMDKYFEQVLETPLLNFPVSYASQVLMERDLPADYEPKFSGLYSKYGLFFFQNHVGETILRMAHPDYLQFGARFRDAVVYSHLIRARLELRFMADRPSSISEALARLGPETWDPYTGRPFEWDENKNTLWTVSAFRAGLEAGSKSGDSDSSLLRVEIAVPPAPQP